MEWRGSDTSPAGARWRQAGRCVLVWGVIPAAIHTAVILLLMHLSFLVMRDERKEAVIDTALEEIDIRDNPVEHLAPTNIKTSAVSDKPLDWKALLQPTESALKPDEQNLVKMLEATADEPLNLLKISVPTDGLAAIPKTGATTSSQRDVAAVVDALSRELAKALTKHNVLLVWLFDESGSMRQSQRDIRERVSQLYAELRGSETGPAGQGKLGSAVVGFAQKVNFVLETPAANPAAVEQAIDRIPVDPTGVENVMAAVRDVIRKYDGIARVQRRALVIFIVTDEPGNDTEHLEEVVTIARSTQPPTHVFVLGTEAVFQRTFRWTQGRSPDAGQTVTVMVDAGPESAFFELLDAHNDVTWGIRPRTPSGFGFWHLSRLARETGGVYYLVHGPQGPTYDPDLMTAYAPELVSQAEYVRRCKANAVRGLIHRLHDLLNETAPPATFAVDSLREELAQARGVAEKRVRELGRMIATLEKGSLANEPNAPQRWEANREVALADCLALRFSARQYGLAVEDFLKNPRLDSRATGYRAAESANAPLRGGDEAKEDLAAVNRMYEAVIAKYAGTPWAWAARNSRAYTIKRYQVVPEIPPRPSPGGPSPKPVTPPKL